MNLLEKTIDFYLTSHDFNGLPVYEMDYYDPDEMKGLIRQGLVEAIYDPMNPNIKFFDEPAPLEEQLKFTDSPSRNVCFYPTPLALEHVEKNYLCRYTALLQAGYGMHVKWQH